MIPVKIGTRGEIVIPKKIREHMGLQTGRKLLLEVKDNNLQLQTSDQDLMKQWKQRAKKHGKSETEMIYGDQLYREVL